MAKRWNRTVVKRVLVILALTTLISAGMFSCSLYMQEKAKEYVDMSDAKMIQIDPVQPGDPIAIVHTTMGDITAELYPEQAPKYVEQFTKLAQEGYYDNTYVYQIQKGVYFDAGGSDAVGSLKDTNYEKVPKESSSSLWPLRGAFCAPTTSSDTSLWKRINGTVQQYCGTRFLVCNTVVFDGSMKQDLEDISDNAKMVTDAFLQYGGIPNYSQQMTVFAQAFGEESFAVIDAITEAETQKKNSASYTPPVEDILITGIEITTYEGPELKQPIPDAPESVMQQTESTESSSTATK